MIRPRVLLKLGALLNDTTFDVVGGTANDRERRAQFVRNVGHKVHLRLGKLPRTPGMDHERDSRRENQAIHQCRHSKVAPARGGHHCFERAGAWSGFEDPQVPLRCGAHIGVGRSVRRALARALLGLALVMEPDGIECLAVFRGIGTGGIQHRRRSCQSFHLHVVERFVAEVKIRPHQLRQPDVADVVEIQFQDEPLADARSAAEHRDLQQGPAAIDKRSGAARRRALAVEIGFQHGPVRRPLHRRELLRR